MRPGSSCGEPIVKNAAPHAGAGRRACHLALAVATLTPLACGRSGPEMASVSGTVTYQGKPVPLGTITFVPVAPDGRNATGVIGSDGSYTLQTEEPGDGAQLGEYRVTVYAHDEPILDYIPKKPIQPKALVPPQYENPDTSGLTATVNSGSNTFDFDLQ
jgi:hypothetical protein